MKTPFLFAACVLVISCGGPKGTSKPAVETKPAVKKETGGPLLFKGIEQYKKRDYENAKASLGQALKLDLSQQEQASAYKYQAFIFAAQKNSAEAVKAFVNAYKADKNFKLDAAEIGNPVWTPAYDKASKQWALASATGLELYSKGKDAYAKRAFNDAISFLELAVQKQDLDGPKTADAYKYLAFTYALQKRSGDARAAFKNAFGLNPNFDLDKSEYGNPVWTPIFDEVKKNIKK